MKQTSILLLSLLALLTIGCSDAGDASTDEETADSTAETSLPADEADAPAADAPPKLELDEALVVVNKIVHPEVQKSTATSGGLLTLSFNEEEGHAGYFDAPENVDRFIAVDAMRLFGELPALEKLFVYMPRDGQPEVQVTREEAEAYHGVTFADHSGDEAFWSETFPASVDAARQREFVEMFDKGGNE